MSRTGTAIDETSRPTLSLLEVRKAVEDLFPYRPLVFWLDFLSAAGIGWAALVTAVVLDGWLAAAAGLVSSVAFLRAVLFIHEIAHFRRGVMPGFTTAWDLLIGIPMLLPSFMYATHTDHHKRTLYGTIRDPEYFPLAHLSKARIVRFVAEMLAVPALLAVRFGILTPLSWLIPPLRATVLQRMSALVINPGYVRRMPKGDEGKSWLLLEAMILLWLAAVTTALVVGVIPLRALLVWYAVAAGLALINQVRTLAAHLFVNDGREMTTLEQLLDSVNVRGVPIVTELVFPVGLKFHALHHYLPDMPYHGLGTAHRRLMKELPADSPYRETEHAGLWSVVTRLWRRAGRGRGMPESWENPS